jgi:CubicO group peptidase (beta-lactamase class C family)
MPNLGPTELEERVAKARVQAGVPGLTFGLHADGRTVSAASGTVNVDTGVEVRPDSLFQVGSITKPMTATLILQAATEGLVDIDASVANYIPLPLGEGEYSGRFTPRQLMAHLSGLDGDLFTDSGRDEDTLARYMILCSELPFLAPPGRHYNYCNAGYAILGRLLEVVRGKTYDNVLREGLLAPLGAGRSTTFPEEAAFARTAVGHVDGPDGKPALAPPVALTRGLGPAGFTLYSTVEDLISFARAHMAGEGPVSAAIATAMRAPTAELPDARWGLGWKLVKVGGIEFFGHDGGTIGQSAHLWCAPAQGLAIAMCANGGRARMAWEALAYPIFQQICGEIPQPPIPPDLSGPVDLSPFEGLFENLGVTVEITAAGGELTARAAQKAIRMPDILFSMRPLGEGRFRAIIGDDDKVVTAFLDAGADGRPELFYAGRLHRRVRR